MDSVIEAIINRRSVRRFLPRQVPEDALDQVLECGRYAPSGGNNQFCHFLVVQSPAVLNDLQATARAAFQRMDEADDTYKSLRFSIRSSKTGSYSFTFGAPTLIIVANQKGYGNAMADAACALQNMMLAAAALGLGSCWVNQLHWLDDEPSIRQLLQPLGLLPEETVCGSLALGWPDGPLRKAHPRRGNRVTYIR